MQNKLIQTALFWFGMIMAAVFICCGFIFLLNKTFLPVLADTKRTILGIVFLMYGAFRATRQYTNYKRMQRENENE